MEIIGNGFIAQNLATIAHRHPCATVVAAGVSSTGVRAPEEFAREEALVHEITDRCHRAGRLVVYLSTASHAIYGTTEVALDERADVKPQSPYGRQKLKLERAIAESGARWLSLRLSHAVGRWQRSHQLLPSLVGQVRSGTVQLHRGAHRDLVDVADVVQAIDGLLAQGVQEEIVNIASGVPQPIATVVRGIEQRMGVAPRHEVIDTAPTLTRVSIAKLCGLLPPMRSVSEPDYLDRILDRYTSAY
ncbi:NAD-dependent epimerase/dehydratase family protein [Streptomyces sp. NPDC005752]|uniref:NAD-dependent epimerase/dehydratase family protein n=1 Tax=Streptomyces sp. NPDC005752 TaxID=3157065 RepID=UPI0033E45F49